jgi:hypothetical protein
MRALNSNGTGRRPLTQVKTGSQAQLSYKHSITANEQLKHIIYTLEIKCKTVTRFMLCNTKLV